jgi:DNA-binding transcriptional LysR family regulator
MARNKPVRWNDRIGRRLKLYDLHVFQTIVEAGSMGKAAERLAISQPSVSKAIADLENTVGVRLFDRSPKGVEVTTYGRALLNRGQAAFNELTQGIKDIEVLADPAVGQIRVGCPEAIACGVLLAVLARFSLEYPSVSVNVYAADNLHEIQLLRDRKVDFIIGATPNSLTDDDFNVSVLYEDRPFIVSGENNRWASRRKIELAELVDEPWLLPRESIFISYLAEGFQSIGLTLPKLGVRSYSVHQRLNLLATDSFIGAESGNTVRFNANRFKLKVLPVDMKVPSWTAAIVTLKNQTIRPIVQTFIDYIHEVAKPMTRTK